MKTRVYEPVEIFILAGGLSTRMGKDKSRLLFGKQTMLTHIRAVAEKTGLPVRVIKKDAVPRCGPLGGIYTAFRRSRADALLFLACDMPFVSATFLEKILRAKHPAIFSEHEGRAGFPCLLKRETAFSIVQRQIADSKLSLQSLAKELGAKMVRPPRSVSSQLGNINTPEDYENARRKM